MTITGSTIINNSVVNGTPSEGLGGGVFNRGKSLIVNESLIANNSAGVGGGIGSRNYGGLSLNNSTITGNSAITGGGIQTGLSGNFGASTGKASTITNVTIVNNTASDEGGGVVHTNINGATLAVSNSMIAFNTTDNCSGDIIDNGFNLASDSTCPAGFTINTPAQIHLGSLDDYGGPTQTYALLDGSSAVDTGNCANGNDQRGSGYVRPLDFPTMVNASNGCDIGAFEVQNVPQVSEQSASPTRDYFTIRQVMLTWNVNTLAIGYEVEVAGNSSFSGIPVYRDTLPPDSFSTLISALPNGIYYWHVRAKLSGSQSGDWSSAESFRVDAP